MSDTISLKTGTAYIPVMPIDDVYEQPKVVSSPAKSPENYLEDPPQSTGFIERIMNWWQGKTEDGSPDVVQKVSDPDELPVGLVPTLNPPDGMPTDAQKVKFPKTIQHTNHMTDGEIFEGLKRMSEATLHQILMIVLKNQMVIEHEAALTTYDTLLTFQKQKTFEQNMVKEVQRAIEKDEKMAEYFKKTQNIALAAAVATGIVTTIGAAAIVAPIALVLGATVGAVLMAGLTILPYASASLGAVSAATKSYYQVRASDNAKLFKEHHHTDQVLGRIIGDWQEYVDRWAKSKSDSEKNFTKVIEVLMELSKMISKK